MDGQRQKGRAYRLRFTDEERADPELAPYIRKAEKAANKLDAAKAKIPKKKVLSPERTVDAATGKENGALRFEETDKPSPLPSSRISSRTRPCWRPTGRSQSGG
jgi:uncharacterized caspase-like protein